MFPFIVTLASGLVAQPNCPQAQRYFICYRGSYEVCETHQGFRSGPATHGMPRRRPGRQEEVSHRVSPPLHTLLPAPTYAPPSGWVGDQEHPQRAGLRPTTLLRAPLSPRSWRRGPHGRSVGGLRAEHGVRGQRPEARAHTGRGRRGACRGLGFTSPHGQVGGELRPPVALGAESHPRPRPKPRVIFNQRQPPSYPPRDAARQGALGANPPSSARQPNRAGADAQARWCTRSGRGHRGACAHRPYRPVANSRWGGAAEISRHLACYKYSHCEVSAFFSERTRESLCC